MKPVWITKKWVTALLHAVCWLVMFSLPFLLRTQYNKTEHRAPQPDDEVLSYFYIVSSVFLDSLILPERVHTRANVPA